MARIPEWNEDACETLWEEDTFEGADDPNLPYMHERELNGSERELRVRGKGSWTGDYEEMLGNSHQRPPMCMLPWNTEVGK